MPTSATSIDSIYAKIDKAIVNRPANNADDCYIIVKYSFVFEVLKPNQRSRKCVHTFCRA